MKIKKASKILALVLAVAMVLAFMPVMMVSAATIDPETGVTSVEGDVGETTVAFTVNYQMTATTGEQVTLLVTKDTEAVTYLDEENTLPNNIAYIDQVDYDETGTFTFTVDKPEINSTYYVKVGGTDINAPATNSAEIRVDSQGGFTVSGYVAIAGSTATIIGTQLTGIADADGLFTITNVPAGTYDLAISKKGALTRTIPIGAINADYEVSVIGNKIPLFIGDGNADGLINNDDLLGVKGIFGKAEGIAGYNELFDVNNDNIINNDDLLAVKGSFSKTTNSYLPWVK